MRWPGFRKVRGQVRKRLARRLKELGLSSPAAYRSLLLENPSEWTELDSMLRITISRFYRDREVFSFLGEAVLPELATRALARGQRLVRAWSAGCGRGEEPYTLNIVWKLKARPNAPPGADLEIIATDAGIGLLASAREAAYPKSSLKELPEEWADKAFEKRGNIYVLRPRFRRNVKFLAQDIRSETPEGRFHLVLLRNLVFTYYDDAAQEKASRAIAKILYPGGALVIGKHERLPEGAQGFEPWRESLRVYRKKGA